MLNYIGEFEKKYLDYYKSYSSATIANYDLLFQAISKGLIIHSGKDIKIKTPDIIPTLYDEYIFARRMNSKIWFYYIFFIRIVLLNNPYYELVAFLKTRKIKKIDLLDYPADYKKYRSYQSTLINSNPKVSIIIPTLNRYNYLKNAIKDLEKQTYQNFEVIIIDQSDNFRKEFYDDFKINLKIIYQKEKALWLARNTGIKYSSSDFLLFFDDDSNVEENWIEEHLKCIDYFNADISSGVSISKRGAKVPGYYKFFKLSEQLDTGNVLINKKVFRVCGLFDRQFESMRKGDNEFGIRSLKNNFVNIQNPFAHRIHFKTEKGGLREMGTIDSFYPKSIFTPLPVPSVLYMARKYWGKKRTILYLLQNLPLSLTPYKFKATYIGSFISVIIIIMLFPIIFLRVYVSWLKSSKMLQQGHKIDSLS